MLYPFLTGYSASSPSTGACRGWEGDHDALLTNLGASIGNKQDDK
jgi:hypothetical protein